MKRLPALAALAAVGLLVGAGYLYRLETRRVRPVEVESPERDLGERPVGTSQVVFRVTNPSDHAAEFISSTAGCGKGCCLKPVTERQPIPPGGSVDVVCELMVVAPEAFEYSGDLFLNDNGLRAVTITVRGTGVAPGAGNEPPKKP